ncbi:MAG: PAS domain-containing sensor histidine kinase, partial [Candidatus Binatia bacterium]
PLAQGPGHELLAVTLENVDVGIVACDLSGAITVFNRSARELYGVPESAAPGVSLDQYYEVYGRDGTTLLAPEEVPLARALRGETVRNDELMIASRSGWARTVTANARPVSDANGRPLGALMTIEDITERSRTEQDLRKELEKAREADRLKSSFLANMSHEIRTPLNIILGYNSMVADYLVESGDSSQGPLLDAISRASKRLMNTVHGILDISKIEVGAFEIHPVALKPAEVIAKEIREFEPTAADRELTLTCEIDEPDATILFDEHCLTQVLEHLLDNAIKFTERGSISARLYRDSEGVLCLDVRDTGVGIDAQYLPYLFEPFSQEESGYTRRFEGSGIGLALVKNYLGFNDAEVTVESEKGKGSVFRIRFFKEVGKAPPQPWRDDEMNEPGEAKDSRKPVVLVVEDDWETQGYMKALLSRRFDVAVAAS